MRTPTPGRIVLYTNYTPPDKDGNFTDQWPMVVVAVRDGLVFGWAFPEPQDGSRGYCGHWIAKASAGGPNADVATPGTWMWPPRVETFGQHLVVPATTGPTPAEQFVQDLMACPTGGTVKLPPRLTMDDVAKLIPPGESRRLANVRPDKLFRDLTDMPPDKAALHAADAAITELKNVIEDLRAQLADANTRANKAEEYLAWIEKSKGSHEEYDRRQNRLTLAGNFMIHILGRPLAVGIVQWSDSAREAFEMADTLLAAEEPRCQSISPGEHMNCDLPKGHEGCCQQKGTTTKKPWFSGKSRSSVATLGTADPC